MSLPDARRPPAQRRAGGPLKGRVAAVATSRSRIAPSSSAVEPRRNDNRRPARRRRRAAHREACRALGARVERIGEGRWRVGGLGVGAILARATRSTSATPAPARD